MKFKIQGLCAAPFTPFKPDTHDLALQIVPQLAQELQRSGVGAAFVGGTTGESLSLTMKERKQLLEEWVNAGKQCNLTIIAHVGCESLRDTQELTKHAVGAGASAVGVMPPTFLKPATIDNLVDYLKQVAACSPNLPLYYYHIACMTGVDFNMADMITKIEEKKIANFNGIKFTDYKIHEFMTCMRKFHGKYDMLFGRDEMLLSALVVGATGAVGSTYNYMGTLYNEMRSAFEKGEIEEARRLQYSALNVIQLLGNADERYGPKGVDVGKVIMELKGIRVGPPRCPKIAMSPNGKDRLLKDLENIGFFRYPFQLTLVL